LVGKDSLNAVEETRLSGAVIRSINSTEVVPTRRNGRTRVEEIAKRLDKSYVSEDLILSSVRYTSWVDYPYISDHAPVLLQLGNSILIVAHPFKLNLAWL
jgi:endonuclease/exonuclease/phosphatase family metal-dependent hydrolase